MHSFARLTILAALLLPSLAHGGTTIEDTTSAKLDIYDPQTGKLNAVVRLKRVEHDAKATGTMKATGVYIEHHKDGAKHIITSDRGLINTAARNGQLTGNVVIRLDDEQNTRIETDTLQWDRKKDLITTDAPVTITRSDMTITGVGLTAILADDVKPVETPKTNGQPEPPAPPTPAEELPDGDRITIRSRVKVIVQSGDGGPLATPKAEPEEPAAEDEKPEPGPEKPADPIVVTSVGPLDIYRGKRVAVFNDDVRAVQGSNSLLCDKLTLRFDRVAVKDPKTGAEEKKMQLVQLDAEGDVRVDDGKTVGTGDALEWKYGDDASRLTGSPAQVTWDNGQKLSADVIRRRESDGQVLCENSPDTGGGPVHFTFPVRNDTPEKQ